MRANPRLLAITLALGLVPFAGVPDALAQAGTAGTPPAAVTPSARDANPVTPTPQAPDMQTYLSMLDRGIGDLRQEISRAESGGGRSTQPGATSPEMIHLMQKVRESWQIAQRAPRGFNGNADYDQTMRDMRARFSELGPQHVEAPQAVESARGALQSLEKLRQAAAASAPS